MIQESAALSLHSSVPTSQRFKTFIFFLKNIFQNFFQTFRADFLGNFWGRAQVLLLFLGLVKTGTKAGESQRDQGF